MSWFFLDQKWIQYDTITANEVEVAYQKYLTDGKTMARFTYRKFSYTIDFTLLEQTNDSTQVIRPIDRWDDQDTPETSLQADLIVNGKSKQNFKQVVAATNLSLLPPPTSSIVSTTTNKTVRWEYEDNGFHPYNDSHTVEALYLKAQSSGNNIVDYSTQRFVYKLDFTNMKQTNTQTNVQRNIRRLLV